MNMAFKQAVIQRVEPSSWLFKFKDLMPKLLLGVIIMLSAQNFASAAQNNRAAKPMFKGAELYSWKLPSSKSWRFYICAGTNRNKTLVEIQNECQTINGVTALKKRLSKLAVQEQVTWSSPYPELSFPPEAVLQKIKSHAVSQKVQLDIAK